MLKRIEEWPWTAINPASYPFDQNVIRAVIRQALENYAKQDDLRESKWRGVERVTEVLVDECGPWATLWSECGTGGGSIGAIADHWCCVDRSFPSQTELVDDSVISQAVDVIFQTIVDVRLAFIDLGTRLESLTTATKHLDQEEKLLALRRMFPDFVVWAIDITECNDSWYEFLYHVLLWCLDVCEIPRSGYEDSWGYLVSGIFKSWIEPDDSEKEHFYSGLYDELEHYTSKKPLETNYLGKVQTLYHDCWINIYPERHTWSSDHLGNILKDTFNECRALAKTKNIASGADTQVFAFEILNQKLLNELGPWVARWFFYGHPGRRNRWCCIQHSLPRELDNIQSTDIQDAIEAISYAVEAVRSSFHSLNSEFLRLSVVEAWYLRCHSGPNRRFINAALGRLLSWCKRIARRSNDWKELYADVLLWALDVNNFDRGCVEGGLVKLVCEYYAEPQVRSEVFSECLTDFILHSDPQIPDSLALHLIADRKIAWKEITLPPVKTVPKNDLNWHERYIQEFDVKRDSLRAIRFAEALEETRQLARTGAVLTFDSLCDIQALVLGTEDVKMRTGPAYAKGGHERYRLRHDLEVAFKERLKGHQDLRANPIVSAARAFLDICFFHPFPDGNARAARLLFDFILTRNELALSDARPVFLFERFAGEEKQYIDFVAMIGKLTVKPVTAS